jgi:hypothetical protein
VQHIVAAPVKVLEPATAVPMIPVVPTAVKMNKDAKAVQMPAEVHGPVEVAESKDADIEMKYVQETRASQKIRAEDINFETLKLAQAAHEACAALKRILMRSVAVSVKDREVAAVVFGDLSNYVVRDDVLYYCRTPSTKRSMPSEETHVIVVPPSCQAAVLRLAHDDGLAGHFGVFKTYERLRDRFEWPTMHDDCVSFVDTCTVCAVHKPNRYGKKYKIGSLPLPKKAFGRVHVDLIGQIGDVPTADGNRYIMMCTCPRTRWAEAFAIPNKEAKTVARVLLEEMFCRYGFPEVLTSDQGTEFVNRVVDGVNELLSIKHLHSTPYHPQANGSVERTNGTIIGVLRRIMELPARHKDWDRYLQPAMFAYRTAVHTGINMTPMQALLSQEVTTPLDIVLKKPTDYLDEFAKETQDRFKITKEMLDLAYVELERKKLRQNAAIKDKPFPFEVGGLCYLRVEANRLPEDNRPAKFKCMYSGPWTILEIFNDQLDVRIRSIKVPVREKVVHVTKLKQCKQRDHKFCMSEGDLLSSSEDFAPGEILLVRGELTTKRNVQQLWLAEMQRVDAEDLSKLHIKWFEVITRMVVRRDGKRRQKVQSCGPFMLNNNWDDVIDKASVMLVFDPSKIDVRGFLHPDVLALARECYRDQQLAWPCD